MLEAVLGPLGPTLSLKGLHGPFWGGGRLCPFQIWVNEGTTLQPNGTVITRLYGFFF